MDNNGLQRNRGHILSTIRTSYHKLSDAQRRVADYVLLHSGEILYHSISELADSCDVSETTVVRFLKKIQYDSYQVFRVEMAQSEEKGHFEASPSEIDPSDKSDEIVEKVLSSSATALNDAKSIISGEEMAACVEDLLSAGRVLCFGVGASFYIAGDLYHKLSKLGISAAAESDEQMISLLSSHTGQNDTLVLVSHSGESRTILESARVSKDKGARVCAITSYPHSTLAELADRVLLSSSSETKHRPDAMLSRIIQLAIIDMITIRATFMKGESAIAAIRRSRMAVARHKR